MADVEALLPYLEDTKDHSNLPTLDTDDEESLDPLINSDIILPQGDGIALASIKGLK
jgi:hypothetical protein